MNESGTVTMPDGRAVGYATHGAAGGRPVLWCHGGPGSRLEPAVAGPEADAAGITFVGIDRPGYGLSTPWAGRSIGGWVPDGLAVADALGIDSFAAVGVSTGGAYALALAALAPDRVTAAVACCTLTDMTWAEGRALMPAPGVGDLWDAPDREAALAAAAAVFGEDGSLFLSGPPGSGGAGAPPALPAADLAVLTDPEWLGRLAPGLTEWFAWGVQGYADDRIADGHGWVSFDPGAVRAPVTVLHGEADPIVPPAHARHTAAIVPGATLRLVPDLGHLSIMGEIVPTLA